MDIEIDGRYLRHANPTSERISDNARRRARNNRRVIQIEDAPLARLLMRFTYELPWRKTPFHPFCFRRFLLRHLLLLLLAFIVVAVVTSAGKTLPKSTICRERTSCQTARLRMREKCLLKRRSRVFLFAKKYLEKFLNNFDVLFAYNTQISQKIENICS